MTDECASPNGIDGDQPGDHARFNAKAAIEGLLRRQKALGDFGDFVLDHEDLDEILNEGCRLVAEALGADLAKVMEIERTNDTALVRAGVGWKDGIVGKERVSLSERSSEAYAIEQGEPVITQDIEHETRFQFPQFLKDHGVVALINVPVFLPGRKPWGLLQVDVREPREFEQEDIEFLKTYSMVLGPVIDRLQHVRSRQESEAKYRTLFDSTDQGFCVIELLFGGDGTPLDYVFIETNDTFERQTGLVNAIGKRMRNLAPDHEQHWFDIYGRIALTGEPRRFEQRAEALGRWYEVYAFRVGNPEDRQVGILFNDVGERRRAEEQLRESDARHRLLIENWAQAVWETDADGVVVADSPSWRALTGQTLDQWLGYGWLDAIHPEDREYAEWQWRDAVAATRIVDAEFRLRAADGGWRWTNVRAAPVLDANGNVEKWAGMNIDIDARKRAEGALRASEEKFRSLFERMDQGYSLNELVRDAEGRAIDIRYLEHNPAMERLTGVPASEAIGRLASEVFPGLDRFWVDVLDRVVTGGATEQVEHELTPLGRWYHAKFYPVGGDRCASLYDDITERKRAEAALRESDERQNFLLRLSDALGPLVDPVAIQGEAARLLGEQVKADRTYYSEMDEAERVAVVAVDYVRGGASSVVGRHPYDFYAPIFEDARAGRTVAEPDIAADSRLSEADLDAIKALGIGSYLSVPLLKAGRLVAILTVSDVKPRHWTDAEIAFVRETAERTWAAVERARAEAKLRESERSFEEELARANVLRGLSARLVTEESLPAVYEEILSAALAITAADAGTVQVYEPSTQSLILLVTRGFETNMTDYFHRVDAGSSTACGTALRTGRREFVDFDSDTDESCQMHVEAGYHSALATPLLSREGSPIGMLNTHWCTPGHRPSEDELRFLDLLARQAADLIEQRQSDAALRESEERFRRFGEASQDILWIRDAETLQWTYLTPAFETIYGLSREEALEGDNYRSWLDLILPEDRERAEQSIAHVRAGEHVTFEYRVKRPADGRIRRLRNTDFPIIDGAGKVIMIGGIGHDITELRESEERRRTSEERFGLNVENARDYAIFTTDADGRIDRWHEGAAAVFGWTAEEAVGQSIEITFTPEDRADGEPAKEREGAARDGRVPNVRWHLRKDGKRIFIDGIASALRDPDGQLTGYLKIGQDVTERRRAEERQDTLLAELQHRVRNIMAMIRSVARRSSETADTVEDYAQHLEGRINALSRTQALLTRDINAAVDLESLILDELDMQAAQPGQFAVTGPNVALPPKAAEVLGLALHELATNSVKYGALSERDGRIDVRWALLKGEEAPRLSLIWSEFGVTVNGEPSRRGFGTELVTQRVPYELHGTGAMDFRPTGLVATMEFPLSEISSILQTDEGVKGAR